MHELITEGMRCSQNQLGGRRIVCFEEADADRPEDVPTTAKGTEEEGDTAANMWSSPAGRVA